ncbi:MAG: T9SS type B sorting domain-containing protein, partial [Flavobacterium sp.]
FHDFWNVKLAAAEPEMAVSVFDRGGKLVASFHGRDAGWDGNYNGQPLPSSDYWFEIRRMNGRVYRGHFSLKR